MSIWESIQKLWGRSQIFDVVIRDNANQAIYPDTKSKYYCDTYTQNSDVFSVINKIVQPASRVPVIQVNKKTGEEKPGIGLELISRPNPFQSQQEFFQQVMTTYEIFGEGLIAAERPEFGLRAGKPSRLDSLPPQWIDIEIGNFFEPITGYTLQLGQQEVKYSYADVMHWKLLNPDFQIDGSHLRGMSPLKPLLKAVAASSSGYDSMVAAFQNQGAYGMLTILGVKEADGKYSGGPKTAEQLSQLESSFRQKMTGNQNRGKIFATNKSAEWINFGLSPVDMNILQSIVFSGGALYDAYNVPDILKSGSQSKTYMNYQEAQKALWNNAIIPTLDGFLAKLSDWLLPILGEEDTEFKANYDDIPALQEDKAKSVAWMVQAGLTYNEIREALGYEPLPYENMDIPLVQMGLQRIDEMGEVPGMEDTEEVLKVLKVKDYRNAV